MTAAQMKLINKYNLSYETTINDITYYTSEKQDGYYFIDDTDQGGIFESKKDFYAWANMRERLLIPAIKI